MIQNISGFRPLPHPPAARPTAGGPPPSRPREGTLTQSIFPGNVDTMPFYAQGRTNGCGTTSEAMILTHLLGRPVQPHDIDNQIRRIDTFTSPQDMVRYARQQGLSAEMYNHGSLSELQGMVARGIPCQALINRDQSGALASLHYVAVVGFGRNERGEDCVVVHDPARGNTPDLQDVEQFIPVRQFMDDWARPSGGFDNFFIAYAPGSTTLPAGRADGIEGSLTTVEGVANVTNGFDRIVNPNTPGNFFRGLVQLPVGVGQTVGGAVTGGIQLTGDWLREKTNGVRLLKNVAGPLGDGLSAAGAAGADVVNGVAEGVESLGQAAEDVVNGNVGAAGNDVKEAVTGVVGGAVDAVTDAGKGAVNAFNDLIRW
jgi:hypothetical protein